MQRTQAQRVVDGLAFFGVLYAGAILGRFGLDKLLGINSSVEGFQQIGRGLGVDPTGFRYFVGVQELGVAAALFASALMLLPWIGEGLRRRGRFVFLVAAVGLLATMIGAIATEFIVRPGEQDGLLSIALRLTALGAVFLVWALVRFGLPWRASRS